MRHSNIVTTLDTRRERKDGTYPIMLRLSHQGKTIPISLGIYIQKKDFDPINRVIRGAYKGTNSVTRLNNQINKRRTEILDVITKLEETGELDTLSIAQLKERVINSSESNMFFTYAERLIKEMIEAKKYGNARTYDGVIKVFKTFRKDKDFTFNQLNYDLLKKFETYYLAKGNSINGLSVNLRTIRAIYNKGIKAGLGDKGNSPFESYKIKHEPTQKRALSLDALKAIMQADIDEEHPCFHTRNYFLSSFYMYGISFIDMAFLKINNIVDGRIRFKRRKTGKSYDLKITPQLQEILSYYIKDKKPNDFIFPVITRSTLVEQYRDVENRRKLYNRSLKELAKECNLQENLTSYVSRHSFATQAMLQNVPLQAISAMLGHSRLSTTEVYLKELPNEVLDEYNSKITLE